MKDNGKGLTKDMIGPFIDKFDNNIYIRSFKEVITSYCFPMALIGSIFYIAANPPRRIDWTIFEMWLSAAMEVKKQLMVPYYFTLGMVSLGLVLILSYKIAKILSMDLVLSPIASLMSYLAFCFGRGMPEAFTMEYLIKSTGPNGLLLGLITSTLCLKLLKFLQDNSLYFHIRNGISPSLSQGFKNMLQIMIAVILFWISGWMAGSLLGGSFPASIVEVANHIASGRSSLLKDVSGVLAASLLSFMGMDGRMLPQPVYNAFMGQGGLGALLPLTLLFTLSRSSHLRQIGKSVIVPALFNVPYPIMFAVPIILNPIYLVPFMLYPAVSTVINYYIASSEILTITVDASGTMLPILSGYFSTAGEVLGVLLQIFNLLLAALIYYPFFRYHESKLVNLYESQREMDLTEGSSIGRIKKYYLNLWSRLLPQSVKKGRSLH